MNAPDLSQAVFIQNQQIKTDSLKVAEAFGKQHSHVIRTIEKNILFKSTVLNSEDSGVSQSTFGLAEFSQHNFVSANYIDEQGKPRPMYEMTKDG
ncbi:Rha family transcriptional regulator [Acinetobacter guillouiae]|uniref:Rha family transcriptional regulator n=1 Tax=Acinetobacter guillouiae TaxID=106649 RepID=UPI003AF67B7D